MIQKQSTGDQGHCLGDAEVEGHIVAGRRSGCPGSSRFPDFEAVAWGEDEANSGR